jgi:hypothetical protein
VVSMLLEIWTIKFSVTIITSRIRCSYESYIYIYHTQAIIFTYNVVSRKIELILIIL